MVLACCLKACYISFWLDLLFLNRDIKNSNLNLVIIGYFLLTIDNLYIPVYLYIDMFYILWVYDPLGSIEHEIN